MKKQNDIVDQMERATLGSFYVDNASVDDARRVGLRPEHFLNGFHRQLCEEIFLLNDRNESFDLLTLTKTMGGNAYEISSLAQVVPSASNCAHYAKAVVQAYQKRELKRIGKKITGSDKEPEEILEELANEMQLLNDITAEKPKSKKEQIEAFHARIVNTDPLPSTGKIELDNIVYGLKPELIVVAARPSMGKSIFAADIAIHAAFKEKLPVQWFSVEMDYEQLLTRVHAADGKIPSGFLRNNRATPEHWKKILKTSNDFLESKLEIDDARNLTIPMIRARCRERKRKDGLGLIVIDYLQLLIGQVDKENRANEIAVITRALANLKKELECPVILISQLSRECEKRSNKRPILSDLRDSGSIEADADIVMFLYRDGYYKEIKNYNEAMRTEIDVQKNRNGDTGKLNLWLDKYCTRFVSDPSQLNESSF